MSGPGTRSFALHGWVAPQCAASLAAIFLALLFIATSHSWGAVSHWLSSPSISVTAHHVPVATLIPRYLPSHPLSGPWASNGVSPRQSLAHPRAIAAVCRSFLGRLGLASFQGFAAIALLCGALYMSCPLGARLRQHQRTSSSSVLTVPRDTPGIHQGGGRLKKPKAERPVKRRTFPVDPLLSGAERHAAQCERILNGRPIFKRRRGRSEVCPNCWGNTSACICELILDHPAPPGVDVVIWTHHKEWGLPSNTGVLLARSIRGARMLMKGLPAHDQELDALLADPGRCCVALWPGSWPGRQIASAAAAFAAADHIGAAAGGGRAPITLLLLDTTWTGARRMARRLPEHVICWTLSEEDLLWQTLETTPGSGPSPVPVKSLIAPLRKRNGPIATEVCTAQAGVAALRALGAPLHVCTELIDLIRTKVERVASIRSNQPAQSPTAGVVA